jgi:hypothetical protein
MRDATSAKNWTRQLGADFSGRFLQLLLPVCVSKRCTREDQRLYAWGATGSQPDFRKAEQMSACVKNAGFLNMRQKPPGYSAED